MSTLHVVRFTFLAQGARAAVSLVRLGERQVPLQMNFDPRGNTLLVITDTLGDLPQAGTRDNGNNVQVRVDPANSRQRIIAISGNVLKPALTHAWAPRLSVKALSDELLRALGPSCRSASSCSHCAAARAYPGSRRIQHNLYISTCLCNHTFVLHISCPERGMRTIKIDRIVYSGTSQKGQSFSVPVGDRVVPVRMRHCSMENHNDYLRLTVFTTSTGTMPGTRALTADRHVTTRRNGTNGHVITIELTGHDNIMLPRKQGERELRQLWDSIILTLDDALPEFTFV